MSDHIKPCPLCGAEATYFLNTDTYHYVMCSRHEVCLGMAWASTKEEAISKWNEKPDRHQPPSRVLATLTFFDDESVREKLTVMTPWEAMIDDARNDNNFEERVNEFVKLGKKYRITLEEVKEE